MVLEQLHIKNNDELLQKTLDNPDILFIICFTASWCRPYNKVKNVCDVLKSLCINNNKRLYIEVNIENADYSDLVEESTILCLPTIQIYKKGKMLTYFKGIIELESACLFIQEHT